MTATRQDVQTKIDDGLAEIKRATSAPSKIVASSGPDPTGWPSGHLRTGVTEILAARAEVADLLDPSAPTPTPTPTPSDLYGADVPGLVPPQFNVAGAPIVCTTRAQHDAAVAAIKPGQHIDCRGIVFQGEVIYKPTLSDYAKITYDSACKFTGYPAGTNKPCIWIPDVSHLQLLFDPYTDIRNDGGSAIVVYGADHLVLDGYSMHDFAVGGLGILPQDKDVQHSFFRPSARGIWNGGLNPALDSHAEKGSGIHACIVEGNKTGRFHDNVLASYSHDWTKSSGDAIEMGTHVAALRPYGNRLYAKAENLHYVASSQAGSNALLLWGYIAANEAVAVVASNLQGKAVFSNGGYETWVGMHVAAGHAAECCLNPRWRGQSPWDTSHGVTYGGVSMSVSEAVHESWGQEEEAVPIERPETVLRVA